MPVKTAVDRFGRMRGQSTLKAPPFPGTPGDSTVTQHCIGRCQKLRLHSGDLSEFEMILFTEKTCAGDARKAARKSKTTYEGS